MIRIAAIDNIFTPGAYQVVEGQFVSRKGRDITGYPYTTLEEAFRPTNTAACCSVYNLRSPEEPDELFPWVRFTGPQARRECGLKVSVEWLHLEFDLVTDPAGQKVWPGVSQDKDGIWRASDKAAGLCEIFCESVCPGWNWYMSRGGLHILTPIEPVPYEQALAYADAFIEGLLPAVKRVAAELQIPLSLDRSCAQPSRLMYLPQIDKPGQGTLRLPHSMQGLEASIRLPKPTWLASPEKQRSKSPLNLERCERRWMENFAARWMKSHFDWLAQARVGDGVNNRLYAVGGDVRQLGDIGLLGDTEGWLRAALELWPDAHAEQAVYNGYNNGFGTHTVAVGISDLQRYRDGKERAQKLAKLLR